MSDKCYHKVELDKPTIYHIRVQGHLDAQWQPWFEGLTISLEDEGTTLLTGPVLDQAALYGFLRKVRDLGLPLLLVVHVGPCEKLSTKLCQCCCI